MCMDLLTADGEWHRALVGKPCVTWLSWRHRLAAELQVRFKAILSPLSPKLTCTAQHLCHPHPDQACDLELGSQAGATCLELGPVCFIFICDVFSFNG